MLTVITPENYNQHAELLRTVIKNTNSCLKEMSFPTLDSLTHAAYVTHYEPSSGLFGKLLLRPYNTPHISDEIFSHFGLLRRQNIFIVDDISHILKPISPFFDTDHERDCLMRHLYQSFYQGLLRFALPRLIDFMIVRSSAEKFEDLSFLGCWPFKSSLKTLRVQENSNETTVYSLVPVDEAAFLDFKIRVEGPVFSPFIDKTPIKSYC